MKKISIVILVAATFSIASLSRSEQRYEIQIGNSPQMGPADAAVTIIEFLDFQ